MATASAEGAQAILFPELFLTGYLVDDRLGDLAEPTQGPSVTRLAEMSKTHQLLSVVGFPEVGRGVIYNSACVIERDGSILGVYRKTHLFGDEPEAFTSGDGFMSFDTSIGRIGILICYDIEFPESARSLALDGVGIVLTPTASMEPFEAEQDLYARVRARENGIFVAIANHVGHDRRYRYFGRSTAVDPRGKVLGRAGSSEELLVVDIHLPDVEAVRGKSPYLTRRQPSLYGLLGEAKSLGTGSHRSVDPHDY